MYLPIGHLDAVATGGSSYVPLGPIGSVKIGGVHPIPSVRRAAPQDERARDRRPTAIRAD